MNIEVHLTDGSKLQVNASHGPIFSERYAHMYTKSWKITIPYSSILYIKEEIPRSSNG